MFCAAISTVASLALAVFVVLILRRGPRASPEA